MGDRGLKDHILAMEVGRTVVSGRQWSERSLSGEGGRKNCSRWETVVRKIIV
ncbi:hypothetical protein KFK09_024231 [Dendrobium nobile]|uniref:Uncharacterized protein n=1 Tax=Dendrobium nobile TaxID=94219 RepID=A0A8T3AD66_DENNO|nr:hypothetical protein KFK09_024231 [Dendrobium nobile]